MIGTKIRAPRLPDDYDGMAALWNEWLAEPTTAEGLAEEDRKMYEQGQLHRNEEGKLAGYDRLRQVAEAEDGRLVGYSTIWRAPWTPPGMVNHFVLVAADAHGQGIGAELTRSSREWAREAGADTLLSECWDDDERAIAFARRGGFETERRSWQSVLDLTDGQDPSQPEDRMIIERLEEEGIAFASLADLPPGEETLRRLHELCTSTYTDIPGFLGETMPYGEWLKWGLQVEGYAPARVLVAMDGERLVGICNVIYNEDSGGMYHEYTGVAREYRGRGIARALKLLSIRLALRAGARYLRTDNDSLNVPMLAINRRLGYRPLRGRHRLIATLEQGASTREGSGAGRTGAPTA
ncbi:GNAT family N-acetyltransferase [Paenibacillus pasadenensis]|uniref:Putative phosphinothricin acetyltransferase n=1 Tax=Paenibacillus pasadenensis TaxID=217090 RepID=A0A2N5NCT4_9BACL|nr:GNAT family N-acetyltransferase [Paenibacillus pasadenensis]PLT48161.1 putative phosphinothricin acetyltransferase [Paenibacillus pasadenensis]